MERDEILRLDDAELSRIVKLEFSRGTGNGGQKRNKTSTAVRVVLDEYGLAAADCSERSQHRNRAAALRKLRMLLALKERRAPQPPPRTRCAMESPDYPLFAARLLDAVAAAEGDYRRAAAAWGVSPSALLRTLERDPALWNWLNKNFPRFFARGGENTGEEAEK
ncbi:MAG: peptide chain release factor-like protein [Lentisphaeria bacterium]|nr:peptide chain release factor-like protein [Lentisphaeria bacterium]